MGGKDGSLYEFAYQSQEGWFGKKTRKLNHSSGALRLEHLIDRLIVCLLLIN